MKDALIYAAGFGTRMKALTANTPKPLLKLKGKALIDYTVDMMRAENVQNFHINAAYLSAQINAHFEGALNVQVHDEPDGPYETGGTLKKLAGILPEVIFTANSDVIFDDASGIETLRGAWHDGLDALLLCVPVENTRGHSGTGDFYIEDTKPLWKGDRPSAPYVYTGLQLIRPKLALEVEGEKFSNREIWRLAEARGRMGAAIYNGRWTDIGTQEALEAAEES